MEILVFVLLFVGLLGCVFPIVPGPPIAYLSLVLMHNFTDYNFSFNFLIVMFFIILIITILDYWLQIYGVKRFGGGKKAIKGTTIGLLVGIFILPFGIVLGPFIGAFIGAFLDKKDNSVLSPIKVASGALIGFFGGIFLKIFVTLYIIIVVVNKIVNFL